jgi:hypothetical protein
MDQPETETGCQAHSPDLDCRPRYRQHILNVVSSSFISSFGCLEIVSRSGFNASPTKKETDRLYQFIKSREAEKITVEKELSKEKKLLETCNNAIFNLELILPEGKQILTANEGSLASFLNIQSHLHTIELIEEKSLKEEPTTKTLYSELRNCSQKPLKGLSEYIDDQISNLKADVRVIWDKVRELEIELGGWKKSKRLLERAIKRLKANYSEVQADISLGNESFRAIWRMPSELWAKIFQYTIQEKLASYLKENQSNLGMRPPIFDLSQVCQNWKYIINGSPELWSLVYVAPANVWRQDEHDLAATSLEKGNAPITIITSLNQSFWNGYQHHRRYDKNGALGSIVSPNENTIFNGKEYTLLVDMHDDHNTVMQRLSYFPLRQPTSLVFSSRSSVRHNYIFNYFSTFSTVKSFSLINDNPSSLPNASFASYLPQLEKLTLHVKTFPNNVQIGNLLTNTLHELYLRNDGGGNWPNIPTIHLPQLRVLGVTSPGSYLLDKLTAKGLKSLTLYGPQDCGISQMPSSQQSSTIYSQLVNLKFEDWRKPDLLDGSLGAVVAFGKLVSKLRALETVKFIGSFVDGKALASVIRAEVEDLWGLGCLQKLEEVTLSDPSGITNDQCKGLKDLVARVKIYV